MSSSSSGGRERLAWAVVFTSFAVWLALIIAVPVSASRFFQQATEPLLLSLEVNQGTIRVENGDTPEAYFAGDVAAEMEAPVQVLSSAPDAATLLVYTPEAATLLGRLQVYGNTTLDILSADTPRFERSAQRNTLRLNLENGRLRFKLPSNEGRPFEVVIETPHGQVGLPLPGNYSIDVNNLETQVITLEGQAVLESAGAALTLADDQRGVIPLEAPPRGPLSTERNLVRNGDFSSGTDSWDSLAWNVELGDQPAGQVEVSEVAGEPVLRFHRVGEGHADAGVRQVINQDVRDNQAVRLEVSLRIRDHSLMVCGSLGSECPLTVRIEYEDENGNDQFWQQGFFANGSSGAEGTPDVCVSCAPPRAEHFHVTSSQSAFYRADLLELLPQYGIPQPARIKSVSLLAAGHSFDLEVQDVSLIVQE